MTDSGAVGWKSIRVFVRSDIFRVARIGLHRATQLSGLWYVATLYGVSPDRTCGESERQIWYASVTAMTAPSRCDPSQSRAASEEKKWTSLQKNVRTELGRSGVTIDTTAVVGSTVLIRSGPTVMVISAPVAGHGDETFAT